MQTAIEVSDHQRNALLAAIDSYGTIDVEVFLDICATYRIPILEMNEAQRLALLHDLARRFRNQPARFQA